MHTFDQLSKRLSSSSLALAPTKKSPERHNKTHSHKTKKSTGHHTRAKSAPDLSLTPLGPASSSGVRYLAIHLLSWNNTLRVLDVLLKWCLSCYINDFVNFD